MAVRGFMRRFSGQSGGHVKARVSRWCGSIWTVALVSACGHLGVDLDGADASVRFDAGSGKDADSDYTKPNKSEPSSDKSDTSHDSKSDSSDRGTTDDSLSLTGKPTSSGASDAGTGVVWLDAASDGALDPPRDASADEDLDGAVDASELDPETDASGRHDAADDSDPDSDSKGRDSGSTDETVTHIPDDNAYTCDPSCSCGEGEECELECHLPECTASCGASGRCVVHSGDESTTVTVECAAGARCDASGGAPTVHAICKGDGDCQVACGEGQKCEIDCVGSGTCTAVCLSNATCHVNCFEGSTCYVSHSPNAVVDLVCSVDNIECGNELLTCNGECP